MAAPIQATQATAGGEAAGDATSAPATGPYVLNLCSSTTPMALAQTDLPELKRFSFFVSRRFEEGRERFRLHMGHFATLAEAEEWLGVVREIYPGAWAGEAPGRKLRERAAAAAAAAEAQAAVPVARERTIAAPVPATPVLANIPVLQAAPPRVVATPAVVTAPAAAVTAPPPFRPAPAFAPSPAAATAVSRAAPVTRPAATPASTAARQSSVAVATRTAAVSRQAATPASTPARQSAAAAPPAVSRTASTVQPPRPGRRNSRPVFEDSNVREVLKALGDASATGETRLMRAPPPPAPRAAPPEPSLSDTQVLALLETRRSDGAPAEPDAAAASVPLLKPDDTGTRRVLREAVGSSAPVAFAVQLQWAVQPVELGKVPPLAIFSAYTLYTIEGSREGRKWYGLRLGFFSDAISARQVAHYVRSEFGSVAVVPVSPHEKTRALCGDGQAPVQAPADGDCSRREEFKLIDDDTPLPAAPAASPAPARPVANPRAARTARAMPRVAAGRAVGSSPAGRRPRAGAAAADSATAAASGRGKSVRRAPGRVGAGERRGVQTLEETLEILGASELSIDNGNGEILNDSGVRHLKVEQVQKNSPFARLLERLSERSKKG
ncbi:MAG: hypothetical protein JSR67_16490 [Proteobacteria bacterium]|nr:hypothetical protein [Pseudomonadota bacterium]